VRRALVTGASGFVGRPAVAALKRSGYEVHGVARKAAVGIEVDRWHEADLLVPSALGQVVREAKPSHLVHLAWTTEQGGYWEDPANQDWVAATGRLLDAFAEVGGKRVVLSGTCAQYDWSGAAAMSETRTARNPSTAYGRAKQAAEEMLTASAAEAGLSAATALLFSPYGPYEKPERLIPSVARRLLAGEEAKTTAGRQVRDFLHIDDCGWALAAVADSELTGSINIGSGEGASVADVATKVAQIVGREDILLLGELGNGDNTRVVAEIDRLRGEVGFTPRYGLDEGLRDVVDWWRQRMRRR
jgi:nucleoside-diphosphate-sugar epimerase